VIPLNALDVICVFVLFAPLSPKLLVEFELIALPTFGSYWVVVWPSAFVDIVWLVIPFSVLDVICVVVLFAPSKPKLLAETELSALPTLGSYWVVVWPSAFVDTV